MEIPFDFTKMNKYFRDIELRIKQKEIEKTAYFLWENSGKPEGKDLEFWLLAEKKHENRELLDTFEEKKYFFNDCFNLNKTISSNCNVSLFLRGTK